MTGMLQYSALRRHVRNAAIWIPVTIGGHILSAAAFYFLARSSWFYDLIVRLFEAGDLLPTALYAAIDLLLISLIQSFAIHRWTKRGYLWILFSVFAGVSSRVLTRFSLLWFVQFLHPLLLGLGLVYLLRREFGDSFFEQMLDTEDLLLRPDLSEADFRTSVDLDRRGAEAFTLTVTKSSELEDL
jgi:hypothetical protein